MPPSHRIRALLIEQREARETSALRTLLDLEDHLELTVERTLGDGLHRVGEQTFEVALVDLDAPGLEGLAGLKRLLDTCSEIPLIVVADRHREEDALATLRLGVEEYVVRGRDDARQWLRAIRRAMERHLTPGERWTQPAYFAMRDPETGLANRHLLIEHLQSSLAQARRFRRRLALLHVRLQGFHALLDERGVLVTSRLFRAAAARVVSGLRASDVVTRGIDRSLLVLLPEIRGQQDAVSLARLLLARLSRPFRFRGEPFGLRPGIGIALAPASARSAEEIIRQAESASADAIRRHSSRLVVVDRRKRRSSLPAQQTPRNKILRSLDRASRQRTDHDIPDNL